VNNAPIPPANCGMMIDRTNFPIACFCMTYILWFMYIIVLFYIKTLKYQFFLDNLDGIRI
jgi:hypothetical protein